jgi:hypothetical protein
MTEERGDYLTRFEGQGIGTKHKQKPLSVLLPAEADAVVRSLPNRSEKLRQWILDGMKAEGLLPQEEKR